MDGELVTVRDNLRTSEVCVKEKDDELKVHDCASVCLCDCLYSFCVHACACVFVFFCVVFVGMLCVFDTLCVELSYCVP